MEKNEIIRVLVLGKSSIDKNFMFNALIGEEKYRSNISSNSASSKFETLSLNHKNRTYLFLDIPGIILRYILKSKIYFKICSQ